jgi:membrane-bound lytic murein transglycosylase B
VKNLTYSFFSKIRFIYPMKLLSIIVRLTMMQFALAFACAFGSTPNTSSITGPTSSASIYPQTTRPLTSSNSLVSNSSFTQTIKTSHHPGRLKARHSTKVNSAKSLVKLPPLGTTPSVLELSSQIADEQLLPIDWVTTQLSSAHFQPSVIELVKPAPQAVQKNWSAYRARFLDPKRIALGLEFWRRHKATLERAELEYGVPSEIILGILGIETMFGQHMGAYPVIDSLTTLSLAFPLEHPRADQRKAFFRNELGVFLKEMHTHPPRQPISTILGSYAGAIGAAQFMPSSLIHFAVDYDHDGQIDLTHSADDAIGSVANYLKSFGWTANAQTRFSVDVSGPDVDLEGLLLPDILPSFSAEAFEAKGAKLSEEGKKYAGLLALIELENGKEPKLYLAGTENFYVITRYNWSSYYAMAVIELGAAVKAQMGR